MLSQVPWGHEPGIEPPSEVSTCEIGLMGLGVTSQECEVCMSHSCVHISQPRLGPSYLMRAAIRYGCLCSVKHKTCFTKAIH